MDTYFYLSIIFFIISVLTAKYKSKHVFNAIINASSIFIYFALTILYFSADYFTNEGINDAVLYTVQYGLGGAGFGEYALLLSVTLFFFVVVFAISYIYFRVVNNSIYPKPKKIKGSIHNIFLILAFLFHPFVLDSYAIYQAHNPDKSFDFNKFYKEPIIKDKENTTAMNIVYIYAESLERTYFDEKIFPKLVSNLKQLKEKSTEFTNINQVPETGWTISGMVASQCAIPLFTNSGGNSMGNADTFLSGAECLGDVLKNRGYHLLYLQGSSTYFSGINNFYSTHGFNEIYGREELESLLEEKSYVNGWGLYDDTIFDIGFEKFEKLSEEGRKFGLFMATMDTHHPNGHPSKSCKDIPYQKGENSILNAVHCSDYLISKFIQKIQNSNYANKTLIVLTSDHLAMKNTASDLLAKGNRRDLFLIFDPRKQTYNVIEKKGSMLDVAPTVLSRLGIDTDLGLGRNLFTKSSLYASFDDFEKKLLSWRDYVLAFWEFPKVTASYDINISDQNVNMANHSYTFPVLFKISENKEFEPIFSAKKLNQYVAKLDPKQKFIWIDKCTKINFVFDYKFTDNFCVAQGNLAGDIEVVNLQKSMVDINTSHMFTNTKIDMKKYYPIRERLLHMAECQKPKKGKVSLTSSEFITSKNVASAIRTNSKNFGLRRGLNLLTVDQDGIFNIQYFDVYASQIEANLFLNKIKSLIKHKKFWAIVSHDAVKNTHLKYKEKLSALGLKLLATLNGRVAYIAYQDIGGNIKEYSSKTTLCQIIPSYIKPLTDEEIENIRREKQKNTVKANLYRKDVNRFIAHAGGSIDGHTYTNSLEALNFNYGKGFKLFELDIIQTSDNIFVAAHDWKGWQKMTGYQGYMPPSKDIFKSYKSKNKYTPLDIDDINKWFKDHPDAILVTDKVNTPIEFSNKFIDKSRLMMELFSWDAVIKGIESNILSPMPTGSILNKIKGDKIAYLKKLGITDIASSRRIINTQEYFIRSIVNAGINIYAFHVNHDKGKDEAYVVCNEHQYFYGLYADKWDFNALLDCSKN